ncbi:hypothetical protein IDH00_01665, partial [Pelagibacterales bacterium SAG-MED21]|nr:hypothetical protein [Pelagibacterales bacterium SAG-MED21]
FTFNSYIPWTCFEILSRYIIEEIKKRTPIWKKEHYQNNEADWLKGNPIQYEKN